MRRLIFGWLLLAVLLPVRPVQAQGLTVAAASDLQGVLPQIAARFERETGETVRVTLGSSGNFFAQIQNGAPFDIYLSADIDYPRQLEKMGLAEPGSLYQYATGEIVLWTRTGGPSMARGLESLLSPDVRRIAIANPEHAPYGRAAVAALRSAGLYERLQSRLVLGENISQAAQFVQSGNADAGIIARSLALTPGLAQGGVATPVPAGSYPPIEQAAVIVKASRNKALAARFLAFLKTPSILALMRDFGFQVPAP